jgi:hypothetical protein
VVTQYILFLDAWLFTNKIICIATQDGFRWTNENSSQFYRIQRSHNRYFVTNSILLDCQWIELNCQQVTYLPSLTYLRYYVAYTIKKRDYYTLSGESYLCNFSKCLQHFWINLKIKIRAGVSFVVQHVFSTHKALDSLPSTNIFFFLKTLN